MHENWPPPDSTPATNPPSAGACVGRCNSRWRQAVEAHDRHLAHWIQGGCRGDRPAPVELEPWAGEPLYCRKCAARIRGALRELPLAYEALNAMVFLSRTASADEEHRGRSDVAPSPSPGADHQDEILRTATAWEDELRRHLKSKPGQRGAGDDQGDRHATLTAATEYLNAHFAEMMEWTAAAADFGEEIGSLHHVAVAMVKNKPVRKQLLSPCPTCDVTALVQEEGVAGKPWYVECNERAGGCGRLFSESELSWLTGLRAEGHVMPTFVVST